MNKRQVRVTVAALALIAIMGIFPPWSLRTEGGREISRGYSFITSPACPICSINISRLFVQWVVIGVIGVGITLALKSPTK